ncbi:MAG TPA: ABC transporter permease [Aggregatilineales bacterium]|nr:ABC transporter permease [Anaerolineales bacterium]HRE47006.1 ABC transporter permease [Aggregatilineales bacterium]
MTTISHPERDTTPPEAPILNLKADDKGAAQSNLGRSLKRLRKHRMAMVGAGLLTAILLYVIIGSFVYSEKDSNFNVPESRLQAPSEAYAFGTDRIGRDIFIRTIYGGQISLFIAITAVTVQIVVGVGIGLLAGYLGGIIDSLLMRVVDAMLSIPQILIALISVKLLSDKISDFRIGDREFSNTLVVMIFVIGLTSWMRLARIVRSVVLSIKEQEYITAARSLGLPPSRILMRHVLPNCIAPIIVSATLGVASAILLEAYLGFLGLGVRPPTATWGSIIADANEFLSLGIWWYWFFPALFIMLTVLGINFLGDGLRDAFDPKSLNR